jgi:hypothetical protein
MRAISLISGLLAIGCLCSPAWAEGDNFQLIEISGKVLVNTGKGFAPAVEGQTVGDGSKILVGENAVARISGPCELSLPEQRITSVNLKTLCNDVIITPTAINSAPGGIPPVVVGLGFAAVAAGAAILVTATENNNSVSAPAR